MRRDTRQLPDGRGGTVSAVIVFPDAFAPGQTPGVILAHGAGVDMRSPLLVALCDGLAQRGFLTVRFNFPYTERRAKVPDRTPVLEACYRAVIDAVRGAADLRPPRLAIGGKSMGGRMATHLAAQGDAVDGLLLLGYPLHPAGQPQKLRAAHLPRIAAPMLFFAGTRDALCSLDLLRPALAACTAPVTLHVIDGGDHSFKVLKRAGRDQAAIEAEIVDASAAWLRAAIG